MSPENTNYVGRFNSLGGFRAVAAPIDGTTPSDNKIVLSLEQTRIITFLGHGRSNAEISNLLGFAEQTIREKSSELYNSLGVPAIEEAMLRLVYTGTVNPAQFVDGFDLSLFDNLTRLEHEQLAAFSRKPDQFDCIKPGIIGGLNRSNQALAKYLNCAESTVKQRFVAMYDTLGLRGFPYPRLRLVVLHLAYQ